MEILGFAAFALIGLSLGLIGAGGSILTVPVLVFLFGMPTPISCTYSLFVVGLTSLINAAGKYRTGDVLLKSAVLFGLLSSSIVWLVRRRLLPYIPEEIGLFYDYKIAYSTLSMVLFALLMLLAARAMIGKAKEEHLYREKELTKRSHLICHAVVVGLITGLLGAGGGFLIIPGLIIFLGMDVRKAVGTSLAIIAINAVTGFLIDLGHIRVDWLFLLLVTGIALAGSVAGSLMALRLNGMKLKVIFGWFVLLLGSLILCKEMLTGLA